VWEFVQDRPGIDLDLFVANAVAASGHSVHPRLVAAATFVPAAGGIVTLLGTDPRGAAAGVDVERLGNGAPLDEWQAAEALLCSKAVGRLRQLERPVRLGAQQWTDAMAEVAERLNADGVPLDTRTVPTVSGATVRYWSTKIGTAELLARLPSVAPHVPRSTIVAGLADAIAVAETLAGPSVLKPNETAGGAGIVALAPGDAPQPDDLARRMRATVGSHKHPKKRAVELNGPYLLQERVGTTASLSPTLDFWIEDERWTCIALAEQIIEDGFRYAGACFPGRLDPATAVQCTALGGDIAEELRAHGYRGLLNVDFLVDDERIWVMELNVRQSAPLDQSLRMTAETGPGWRETTGFRLLERSGELERVR
jgi:ATP-grasp domain